ncbi:MAG: right-handed parallel beta-helix repeat-containing protein [Candidatus Binatus sp.]
MRVRFVMFLVAAIAVVASRASTAVAGKLSVCASGCPYSSIQAAIDAAKTGDTITIAPGTYTETLSILSPTAAKQLTLQGSGAFNTIVNGDQLGMVLEVDTDYDVTISGVTFTNGEALAAGGILNHGKLKLIDVTVTQNVGQEAAGGIANDIDGRLTLIRCTVTDNVATFPPPPPPPYPPPVAVAAGAGLRNFGIASLTDTTISGNNIVGTGGGGGGIENQGELEVTKCSIVDNHTTEDSLAGGGGLDNNRMTSVRDTPIMIVKNSVISGNSAATGGGIQNLGGSLSVTASQILANSASLTGGGLYNGYEAKGELIASPIAGNVSGVDGGGVANDRGKLTLTVSPIEQNQAVSTTTGQKGGGLAVFGGTVRLTRSRVTQNTASGPIGGLGGGIVITDDGRLTLERSPITGNTASTDGGGIYVFTGTVSSQKSPVTNNLPDNCTNVPGC